MRGRPRLPDAVKAAKGTLQPCRVNKNQPQLEPVSVGEPPDRLPERMHSVWHELARQVDPMRVASASDLRAFELLVRAVALADETSDDPCAEVSDKVSASKAALTWLQHFGMTPASRAKVNAAPPKPKADPLAEFLS